MDSKKKKDKKKKVRTELDAVHPRFTTPIDEEEMLKYETEHHYYCNTCKVFIAPTNLALKIHFKEEIQDHPASGSCLYCKGDTFVYKFNGNIRYFHNCADYLNKRDS